MIHEDQSRYQRQNQQLEDQTKADVVKPLKDHVAQFGRLAHQEWVNAFGSTDAKADDALKLASYKATLKGHLAAAPSSQSADIARAVEKGHALGTQQTIEQIDDPSRRVVQITTPNRTAKQISKVNDNVSSALDDAGSYIDLLGDDAEFEELTPAFASASSAVTSLDRSVTWFVNQAISYAVTKVSNGAGLGQVFIGERDACLDCNSNVGKTSDKGFDGPPVHPNCRCSVAPWSEDWTPDEGPSYPEALEREANRSVLKGWSGSDSNTARLAAADRLLEAGTKLPASVQQSARRAIKTGAFAGT